MNWGGWQEPLVSCPELIVMFMFHFHHVVVLFVVVVVVTVATAVAVAGSTCNLTILPPLSST